jgi:hypothetical protein
VHTTFEREWTALVATAQKVNVTDIHTKLEGERIVVKVYIANATPGVHSEYNVLNVDNAA